MINKHYQKHKERLRKKALERYKNLSEVEKLPKTKKTQGKYQNFTEEEKRKRCQYIRNVSKSYLSIEEILLNT